MVLQGLSGPVTQTEISSFKTFMQGESPPAANTYDNTVADGTAGMEAEACGLMYEVSHDSQILDLMIKYADAFLALRNNTNTGAIMWDGSRAPVWLTKPPTNSDGSINIQAGYAGCENNDIVGHIADCAKLILQTPALWNTPVAPEVGEQRNRGSDVQADDEGQVRRLRRGDVEVTGPAPAHERGNQDVVTQAGDREELGNALDQADHHCLGVGHQVDGRHGSLSLGRATTTRL
jgi:hypothetical protein